MHSWNTILLYIIRSWRQSTVEAEDWSPNWHAFSMTYKKPVALIKAVPELPRFNCLILFRKHSGFRQLNGCKILVPLCNLCTGCGVLCTISMIHDANSLIVTQVLILRYGADCTCLNAQHQHVKSFVSSRKGINRVRCFGNTDVFWNLHYQ